MITIELEFPAGRYHATPWGRNVNEGDVEWPPSPFRLARALIDVWKRRKPEWPEQRIEPILKGLSGSPLFVLPPASASHTRSFLSSNEKDSSRKQLIFDAFVVTPKAAKVLLGFETDLEKDCLNDLDEILKKLDYLGRSESWVRARLTDTSSPGNWNCLPVRGKRPMGNFDLIQVACCRGPEAYLQLPQKPNRDLVPSRTTDTSLPCSWLEAIGYSTQQLLKEGWSSHPTLDWVTYARRSEALEPSTTRTAPVSIQRFRCAKYALSSRVLPRIQETFPVTKRIREHLMGIHKRIMDNDPNSVSWRFSGKDASGNPLKGHKHAFYQPLDEDNDGYLDHLLVYSSEPFSATELEALDGLRSIWQSDGRPDVRFVLTGLYQNPPKQSSNAWISSTPFVLSRHYRKGRGTFIDWLEGEIAREREIHYLPRLLSIEWIMGVTNKGRTVRWFEFVRKYRSDQPVPSGHGCILRFEDDVEGPFTLGSLCHYGLGYFKPLNDMKLNAVLMNNVIE